MIRGTSLLYYNELVTELGGDPHLLLHTAGIDPKMVGDHESFFSYRALMLAMEAAAAATDTPDFGRRLGFRQDIEILGPVGAAAMTARTVADAFVVFERYLSAYSPVIRTRFFPEDDGEHATYEFSLLIDDPPPAAQTFELTMAVSLGVFRVLLVPGWTPLRVHLPHDPVSDERDYAGWYGAPVLFAQPFAGFTFKASDLLEPLSNERFTHQALIGYLDLVGGVNTRGITQTVSDITRRMLPTGAATLPNVADRLSLHPKTLQRRLKSENTTFAEQLDDVRRRAARRYLQETNMTMTHLAHELGYAEQSVLTRSCRRWFGASPLQVREQLREGSM